MYVECVRFLLDCSSLQQSHASSEGIFKQTLSDLKLCTVITNTTSHPIVKVGAIPLSFPSTNSGINSPFTLFKAFMFVILNQHTHAHTHTMPYHTIHDIIHIFCLRLGSLLLTIKIYYLHILYRNNLIDPTLLCIRIHTFVCTYILVYIYVRVYVCTCICLHTHTKVYDYRHVIFNSDKLL